MSTNIRTRELKCKNNFRDKLLWSIPIMKIIKAKKDHCQITTINMTIM